jgi:phosphoribosyl-AMP cyclohydrolase
MCYQINSDSLKVDSVEDDSDVFCISYLVNADGRKFLCHVYNMLCFTTLHM